MSFGKDKARERESLQMYKEAYQEGVEHRRNDIVVILKKHVKPSEKDT